MAYRGALNAEFTLDRKSAFMFLDPNEKASVAGTDNDINA